MIDAMGAGTTLAPSHNAPVRKVLRMVENDRTAGSMPSWEKPSSARQEAESVLSAAQLGGGPNALKSSLAYRPDTHTPAKPDAEFGFGDLFDMVNPLQHIPIIGHLYRAWTGDEIRPIGRIIGGAVFGGALGAASGLVNVIVQEETGKDITGNAMAFAFNGEPPSLRPLPEDPQERLNDAARTAAAPYADLPGALLAFTDLGHKSSVVIEKLDAQDSRMAGSAKPARVSQAYSYMQETFNALPPREPITMIDMSPMNFSETY